MRQNIIIDNETKTQAAFLANKWGMSAVRHLSAVVSRSVERAFVAENDGVITETVDQLTIEEHRVLMLALNSYLENLGQEANSEMMLARPNAQASLLDEIKLVESIIGKLS